MTPEGKVKEKVKKLLKKYNVYYFMPVQMGLGKRSLDFLGCIGGNFFAVETKASGKSLTKMQEAIVREMQKTGADVFVIDSVDSPVLRDLEQYLIAWETDIPGPPIPPTPRSE